MSETSVETAAVAEPVQVVERRGGSVEEAIQAALAELGIDRDDAEIEVLSSGSRAVPGETVSGAEARVRVQPLDEHTRRGRNLLSELLQRMELPARVSVRRADPVPDGGRPPAILDVSGEDLGLLIGWRGETLRALQTVVNLMLGEDEVEGRRLIIDVERYRARREDQVRELAVRLAHRVKRTGEKYTMDAMQPYERRVVHLALAADEGVRTESHGKDSERRIVITPTGPARPELADEGERGRFGAGGGDRGRRGPRGR
ncbi:MAG: RNA-binding cell elongation regulator Jag/EloR [Candidatus Dormibacteria bacterium]